MNHNLTKHQKELARIIVHAIQAGDLPESFRVYSDLQSGGLAIVDWKVEDKKFAILTDSTHGELDALERAGMLFQTISYSTREFSEETRQEERSRRCTVTSLIYEAVQANFVERKEATQAEPISVPSQELTMPLQRFRRKYPDPQKVGFLIMRFAAEKAYARIVETIKLTAEQHGLIVLRADDQEFHRNLLSNVRTLLHGCGFGIAIYDRIKTDEPSANVGLEVGYLMALNKPVVLLKDKTMPKLPTDLTGELYKEFDPHDPEATIPLQLVQWLQDYGIVAGDP